MSSQSKVWFVTGSSSGLGLCITEYALKRGDRVIATLRKPEVLADLAAKHPDRLLVLGLDVTKSAEVTAAFVTSKAKFGRIDMVVNNAGFGNVGEVESTKESSARSMFEVNFWGASYVTREAVKFFREENKPIGGRLLQISSMVGIKSLAGMTYYSASKFALEGLSEGLADELDPSWNIKITLLEPGPFRTRGADDMAIEPIHPAYTNPLLPSMQYRNIVKSQAFDHGDPDKFAEGVYKVAYLDDPPLRLPIHSQSLMILREKGKHLLETADKSESWSVDVLLKD